MSAPKKQTIKISQRVPAPIGRQFKFSGSFAPIPDGIPTSSMSISVAVTRPMPTVAATIEVPISIEVSVLKPMPTVAATLDWNIVAVTKPMPSVAATIQVAPSISVAVTRPMPSMAATVTVPVTVAVAITKPMPVAAAYVGVQPNIAVAVTRPMASVSATIEVAPSIAVAVTKPMPTVAAVAYIIPAINVAVTRPMPEVYASIAMDAALSFSALVLNTDIMAISAYTNFPFNSFCKFAGTYLGASADGIYELSGDSFGGSAINTVIKTPVVDFSMIQKHWIREAWLTKRSEGILDVELLPGEPIVIDATGNTITVSNTTKTFTRASGSWITAGLHVGMTVATSNFTNAANNGTWKISALTALVMTVTTTAGGSPTLTNETNTTVSNLTFEGYYVYATTITDDKIHEERVKLGRGHDGRYYALRVKNRAGQDFDINSIRIMAEKKSSMPLRVR